MMKAKPGKKQSKMKYSNKNDLNNNTHSSNSYGIASLVLGIVSIVLSWVPLIGLIAGILGIIFYTQQKRIFPNSISTSGFITSIIGIVLSAIYFLFLIFFVTIMGSMMGNMFSMFNTIR